MKFKLYATGNFRHIIIMRMGEIEFYLFLKRFLTYGGVVITNTAP